MNMNEMTEQDFSFSFLMFLHLDVLNKLEHGTFWWQTTQILVQEQMGLT